MLDKDKSKLPYPLDLFMEVNEVVINIFLLVLAVAIIKEGNINDKGINMD